MKKAVILVVAFAMVAVMAGTFYVTKHTTETNMVKVDVATMTYGMEGAGFSFLNFHERHQSMRLNPIQKNAMKLKPITKNFK
jgi:hypothetical protein